MTLAYGVIVLTGFVDCFFGYAVFKYALGILLGLAGAGIGAYIAYTLGHASIGYIIIGLIGGAILGMVIAVTLFRVAVALLGAFFAYAILAPLIGGLDTWVQLVVLILCAGVAAYVAIQMVETAIMLATSVTGGFRLVYGGWFFFGGPAILGLAATPDAGWYLLGAQKEPFIAMVVLAALGFVCQLSQNRGDRSKVSEG